MVASHGGSKRSGELTPLGPQSLTGKFGRMFAHLPPFSPDIDSLTALGEAMKDVAAPAAEPGNLVIPDDNPTIPAGYTYLGQFIDHDLTFDPTSLPEVEVDPLALTNFRTAKFDLDNVYGIGPDNQPYMYDRADPTLLLLGHTNAPGRGDKTVPSLPNDHLRGSNGFSVIGDPRNDENLLVAQLHVAFIKFHNKVVDTVRAATPAANLFEFARRTVRWHYQWIVLHDFLKRVCDPAVVDDVLANGRRFYHFDKEPFIPVEFSVAAYRLGHSMVRDVYNYNRVFNPKGAAQASLKLLFTFTGKSGPSADDANPPVPVPADWVVDWRRFFEVGAAPADLVGTVFARNQSRKIDPLVTPQLHQMPDGGPALPVRNLIRGVRLGLPSGQAVAHAMGIPALTSEEITTGKVGDVAKSEGFDQQTPLWFYILKEADVHANGQHLGAVGSRIVAEVFIGLLQGDPTSFLSQHPKWQPTLGPVPGTFGMPEMLAFVNDLNPIGEKPFAV